MLVEALSDVCEVFRKRETRSARPVSSRRFCNPTGNVGLHTFLSAPQSRLLTATSDCQGPPSEFLTYSSDEPADQSQEVLERASGVDRGLAPSEHAPCLVGGTVTLADVIFTYK